MSAEIVLLSGFWFCSRARGNETEEPTIYCLSFLEKVRLNKRAWGLISRWWGRRYFLPPCFLRKQCCLELTEQRRRKTPVDEGSLSAQGLFSVRTNLIKAVHFSFIIASLFAKPPQLQHLSPFYGKWPVQYLLFIIYKPLIFTLPVLSCLLDLHDNVRLFLLFFLWHFVFYKSDLSPIDEMLANVLIFLKNFVDFKDWLGNKLWCRNF